MKKKKEEKSEISQIQQKNNDGTFGRKETVRETMGSGHVIQMLSQACAQVHRAIALTKHYGFDVPR